MTEHVSYPDSELVQRLSRDSAILLQDPQERAHFSRREILEFREFQLDSMRDTAEQLEEVELGHLREGTLGYLAVTRNVFKAMDSGHFKYPEKFEQTVPIFHGLADHAFLMHGLGKRHLIQRNWLGPMYDARSQDDSAMIRMGKFWRGHIPDLTTAAIMTNTVKEHKSDFFKINSVLFGSIEDVMRDIGVEATFFRRQLAWVGMHDVRFLRWQQWHASQYEIANGATAEMVRENIIPGPFTGEFLRNLSHQFGGYVLRSYDKVTHNSDDQLQAVA